MISGALGNLDYSELPVVGYLLDGRLTGFKTPIVQNGREPAIQDADQNGIVRGFIACEKDDIDRIYKPNYPIGRKSVVGKELIFVFKTIDETYYEPRSRLVSRLLSASRDPENVSATDAINIMIFSRMPLSRIDAAIDQFSNDLKQKGLVNSTEWSKKFKERVRGKLNFKENNNAYNAPNNFVSEKFSMEELEVAAQDEIDGLEDSSYRERVQKRLVAYYSIKAAIASANTEKKDQGYRDLFAMSATIDSFKLNTLSFLINFNFMLAIWSNFIRWNSRVYGRKVKCTIPYEAISRVARLDAGERLAKIVDFMSEFRPFILQDKKDRHLPPGLMLGVTIKAKNGEGGLLVDSGRFLLELPENLVSVRMHHNKLPLGEKILASTIRNNKSSSRGVEFLSSVFEIVFPTKSDTENPLKITLGASNSWAVIQTSDAKVSRMLSGGGVYIDQFKDLCGLRRITVIEKTDEYDRAVRAFCRACWRELDVEGIEGGYLLSLTSRREAGMFDERKFRTFTSMWKKIFPAIKMTFRTKNFDEESWIYC
ncbi:hypothetical protein [Azorhizobium sp. AG788]|uniref:hypothetical protein n=1 Tax=Azorhizobium sp. AG788 TaxID=2183897 RepID=UPI003139349E